MTEIRSSTVLNYPKLVCFTQAVSAESTRDFESRKAKRLQVEDVLGMQLQRCMFFIFSQWLEKSPLISLQKRHTIFSRFEQQKQLCLTISRGFGERFLVNFCRKSCESSFRIFLVVGQTCQLKRHKPWRMEAIWRPGSAKRESVGPNVFRR